MWVFAAPGHMPAGSNNETMGRLDTQGPPLGLVALTIPGPRPADQRKRSEWHRRPETIQFQTTRTSLPSSETPLPAVLDRSSRAALAGWRLLGCGRKRKAAAAGWLELNDVGGISDRPP